MEAAPTEFIVLYSKYSPQCKRILDVYDGSYSYIKLVCIDNSVIRAKLTDSKILGIRTVPCVLFVYPAGRIEKFEGPDVTEWVLEQIGNNLSQDKKTYIEKEPTTISETASACIPSKAPEPISTSHTPEPQVTHIGSISDVESYSQQSGQANVNGDGRSAIEQESSEMPANTIPDSNKSVAELAAEMAANREIEDKRLQEQKRQSMTQHIVDDISNSRQADDRHIFQQKEQMAQSNLSYM